MSQSHPALTRPDPNGNPEKDREHLKLLAVFYYVWAGLSALGGCCMSLYIVVGVAMATNPQMMEGGQDAPPPPGFGWFIAGMGACGLLVILGLAGLYAYVGYCLQRLRHRTFCIVMAAITCLSIPLGTILGVFTLVVLLRPSAVALFEQSAMERKLQTPS